MKNSREKKKPFGSLYDYARFPKGSEIAPILPSVPVAQESTTVAAVYVCFMPHHAIVTHLGVAIAPTVFAGHLLPMRLLNGPKVLLAVEGTC